MLEWYTKLMVFHQEDRNSLEEIIDVLVKRSRHTVHSTVKQNERENY